MNVTNFIEMMVTKFVYICMYVCMVTHIATLRVSGFSVGTAVAVTDGLK